MMKSFRYLLIANMLIATAIVSEANVTNDVAAPYEETFELPTYTNGQSVIGGGGWYGDTNAVTATVITTNMSSYSGDLPISGSLTTTNHVLSLEAGSGVLTNLFNMTSTNTWVDMLVQMNPADEMPAVLTNEFSTGNQAGIWLDSASSNLFLRHEHYDTNFFVIFPTNTVLTDITVNDGEWTRLTLMMDYFIGEANNARFFQIAVNGTYVTNQYAYSDPANVSGAGGTYFLCLGHGAGVNQYLSSVKLSGAGLFDEITVTKADPFGVPLVTYTVTVANVTGGDITHGAGLTTPLGVSSGEMSAEYTFTISNDYYLVSYTNSYGDVVNATGPTFRIPSVTNHVVLGAVFAQDTKTLSNAVPQGWIQTELGIYTNDYTATLADDPDFDGFTTADEFLMSTDPADSNSLPRISSIGFSGSKPQLKWYSLYNSKYDLPPYGVEVTTNLTGGGAWSLITSTNAARIDNLDTPYENVIELPERPTDKHYYYRIVATNRP